MREHNCVADPENTDQQLTLIDLLLCLEDRIKKGTAFRTFASEILIRISRDACRTASERRMPT